jgi:ketosteroid isomerase-like protein
MSQENVEVVQSLYEAVNRRDHASAVEYLHPDAEVCPAVVGFDTAGAGSGVKPEEITETPDGRLLAVERWYARGRDGIGFDFEITDVYTFRDGLVARVDGYPEKADALEAAGLRA